MSDDKAHSSQRIASEAYRDGHARTFGEPWKTCDFCGMTREKTKEVAVFRPEEDEYGRGRICEKCETECHGL